MNQGRRKAPLLEASEIETALTDLKNWVLEDGKLHCELLFKDFPTAIEFMALGIAPCEKMDHHPEWFNCYNKVKVWLVTHDSGGITKKDIELAHALSAVAASVGETGPGSAN